MTDIPTPVRWIGEAPAKVNLRLDVFEREDTGFHRIETVFQALDLADRIVISLVDGGGVVLELSGVSDGALGNPERNLAVRAARAFGSALRAADRRLPGVRIMLDKVIPHGAGLGGGSSDAAAVLRGLNELCGHPISSAELVRLGADLGSDVPFFVSQVARAQGWGRGDRIVPLDPLPPRPVLLVVPHEPIATDWAYGVLVAHRARRGVPDGSRPQPAIEASWPEIESSVWNDFEEALFPHRPELAEMKASLEEAGARPALLSGSGCAVFGVFDSEERVVTAQAALGGLAMEARVLRTRTRG